MKARSAIQKGKLLEQHVANQLIFYGLDPRAHRSNGSGNGNREKADLSTSLIVLGQNAGIECKNQKTLAIPDWWRQVKKLEILGREPILAFKLPGDPLESTLVTIYLDTFLRLIQAANNNPINPASVANLSISRDQIYALEQLQRAVHNAFKAFPS